MVRAHLGGSTFHCFRCFQLRGKETLYHTSRFRKPLFHPAANMDVLHITIVDGKNINGYVLMEVSITTELSRRASISSCPESRRRILHSLRSKRTIDVRSRQ